MKIVALLLLHNQGKEKDPVLLTAAYELSSFGYFQRGSIQEMCLFFGRTLVKQTQPGMRQSVEHEEYLCHVHVRPNGLGCVAICDKEYPPRVAFTLLMKIMDEFEQETPSWNTKHGGHDGQLELSTLDSHIQKYQNPAEADKLMKIQKDLDETKIVLHKTIDSVLERGVKLDELVDKSGDLSAQSKMFYKTARSQNQCCLIM
eukprot:TRINITY_DN1854_c0_g1::TRINITY_DN1854_c0_g1_i1::g.14130::m.14130 TRINITY_DN1854_c0_g1::TRINITY_DN1854_c0_g1_i1::g.14130  ORF type:complete len:213 (+),score=29.57,sp/Q9ZRD6/YKT61_ARATH/51.49/2e-65,Longin/PF13774.1/5.5e-17,Synaptobrevin/PF00957.16/1.8e-14,MIS13/PF08202.6/0.011,DUF3867/PF12983.2/0.051 TRINITY_DN1854_c0_g1_i1:35-640(+)